MSETQGLPLSCEALKAGPQTALNAERPGCSTAGQVLPLGRIAEGRVACPISRTAEQNGPGGAVCSKARVRSIQARGSSAARRTCERAPGVDELCWVEQLSA